MVVGIKLSARRISTLLAQAAIVVMAGILLFSGGGRDASAAGGFTFDGVTCMDVHLGNPPTEDNRAVIILSRIEPAGVNTFNITSQSYTGPGGLIPTKPTADPCASQNDGNSLLPTVPPDPPDISDRPTSVATFTAGSPGTLAWEKCQFEPDLLGGMSVLSKFSLAVAAPGKTLTTNSGTLIAYLDTRGSLPTPFCSTTPNFLTSTTVLVSSLRDKTTGLPTIPERDDWDGDGISDWNELGNPPPLGSNGDPFVASVGGIAGLPEVASAPAEALESSGAGTGLIIGLSVVIAAAALALGGGAWYMRRRSVR